MLDSARRSVAYFSTLHVGLLTRPEIPSTALIWAFAEEFNPCGCARRIRSPAHPGANASNLVQAGLALPHRQDGSADPQYHTGAEQYPHETGIERFSPEFHVEAAQEIRKGTFPR